MTFDPGRIVGCRARFVELLQSDIFKETDKVTAIFEFTFEDFDGNEQVELQAVEVDVPAVRFDNIEVA